MDGRGRGVAEQQLAGANDERQRESEKRESSAGSVGIASTEGGQLRDEQRRGSDDAEVLGEQHARFVEQWIRWEPAGRDGCVGEPAAKPGPESAFGVDVAVVAFSSIAWRVSVDAGVSAARRTVDAVSVSAAAASSNAAEQAPGQQFAVAATTPVAFGTGAFAFASVAAFADAAGTVFSEPAVVRPFDRFSAIAVESVPRVFAARVVSGGAARPGIHVGRGESAGDAVPRVADVGGEWRLTTASGGGGACGGLIPTLGRWSGVVVIEIPGVVCTALGREG